MDPQRSDSLLMLPRLNDEEYREAQKIAQKSLDICPTCGSRDERIPESGMKDRVSHGYHYQGQRHECDCATQMILYTRYLLANIGTHYQRLDWSEFSGDPQAIAVVEDYLTNWEVRLKHGYNLVFSAKTLGVGKTWAATHIGKELIKCREKVYFLDFLQMVNSLSDERRQEIEARMRKATLLIIDDVVLGISDRQSDFYAGRFEEIIRYRTGFDLPNIFTTNLTRPEFEREFERIYSLIAYKHTWVNMNGIDYRRKSQSHDEREAMMRRGEIAPIN